MDTAETTPDDDVAAIEQTARALLDDRMAVVRKLASSKRRLADIQAQLDSGEREYGADFAAAQRAGWTDDELSQLGFGQPTRRPVGRPARGGGRRRSTTVKAKSTPAAKGGDDISAANESTATGSQVAQPQAEGDE